jgi:hypothetical protein
MVGLAGSFGGLWVRMLVVVHSQEGRTPVAGSVAVARSLGARTAHIVEDRSYEVHTAGCRWFVEEQIAQARDPWYDKPVVLHIPAVVGSDIAADVQLPSFP